MFILSILTSFLSIVIVLVKVQTQFVHIQRFDEFSQFSLDFIFPASNQVYFSVIDERLLLQDCQNIPWITVAQW